MSFCCLWNSRSGLRLCAPAAAELLDSPVVAPLSLASSQPWPPCGRTSWSASSLPSSYKHDHVPPITCHWVRTAPDQSAMRNGHTLSAVDQSVTPRRVSASLANFHCGCISRLCLFVSWFSRWISAAEWRTRFCCSTTCRSLLTHPAMRRKPTVFVQDLCSACVATWPSHCKPPKSNARRGSTCLSGSSANATVAAPTRSHC